VIVMVMVSLIAIAGSVVSIDRGGQLMIRSSDSVK